MDLQNYTAQKTFSQKHLLTLQTYTKDEIFQILSLALKLKQKQKSGIAHTEYCDGKTLAMVFAKASTRTRVSFETGFYQLGGHPLFMASAETQLGRGEPISDFAQVMSRMVDGIMIRTYAQKDLEELAQYGSIPIINGLTDEFHPCQALADSLTYYEKFGNFDGKMVYIGDGNNVAHSLMIICSKIGMDVAVATPKGYELAEKVINWAQENAKDSGSIVTVTNDPAEAAQDATCVYTDVWASMGQESEQEKRVALFEDYQVNQALVEHASKDYIFMHCLPAHRGEEVSAEICDGKHSVIFDEAENRLHAQKAVMALLMGDKA